MNCRYCNSHIEPKDNWRSILAAFTFALLIGFIGGIFFTDWKLIPKYEQQIKKDGEIKKELEKGYMPSRPEIKKK